MNSVATADHCFVLPCTRYPFNEYLCVFFSSFFFTLVRALLIWAICQDMEMQITCSHIRYFPENIPENLHVK